jgi:hypothetical protein
LHRFACMDCTGFCTALGCEPLFSRGIRGLFASCPLRLGSLPIALSCFK